MVGRLRSHDQRGLWQSRGQSHGQHHWRVECAREIQRGWRQVHGLAAGRPVRARILPIIDARRKTLTVGHPACPVSKIIGRIANGPLMTTRARRVSYSQQLTPSVPCASRRAPHWLQPCWLRQRHERRLDRRRPLQRHAVDQAGRSLPAACAQPRWVLPAELLVQARPVPGSWAVFKVPPRHQ